MTCASLALTTALAVATTSAAQARPDFSGTWTMDEARSVSATQEAFVGPVVWTVTQTDRTITVDVKRGAKSFALTFTVVAKPPGGPPDVVPTSRAYWLNDRLVTELAQNISNQTLITREEWSLQPGGRELLIERLVRVEHGYTVRGGRSYNTARDTFVKVTP
jgi:hypothetical protein